MSMTEAPIEQEAEEQAVEQQDIDLSTTGGSPLAEGDEVVGEDGEPWQEPIENEPEEEPAPEPEEAQSDSGEVERLQAQIAKYETIVNAISDEMERDSKFAERVDSIGNDSPPGTLRESVEKTLRDGIDNTDGAADHLINALLPVLDRVDKIQRQVSGINPQVQRISRELGSAAFQRGLEGEGIPKETQGSKAFQKHVRSMRGQGWFQSLEAREPAAAAEAAANKWLATQAKRNGNVNARATLAAAKNGRGTPKRSQSTGMAERIYRLRKDVGDPYARAYQIRQKDPKAKIVYIDSDAK